MKYSSVVIQFQDKRESYGLCGKRDEQQKDRFNHQIVNQIRIFCSELYMIF